ncbi:flagellar type III secretion system protein FlhB [Ostreiculturibacter nitratireducens]|uniref:flagellar type III secretion system protein FlhB n=1 Tax=Ostreiculturibacter nitratireducens TaxID=3075226 RepID=UPI0031B63E25
MSGAEDGAEEKEHEPSARKLEEARKRGEVVKSADLTTAAVYAGLWLAGLGLGAGAFAAFGNRAMVLLDQAENFGPLLLEGGTGPIGGLIGAVLASVAPWFLIPAALVLAVLFAQRALVFVPEKLAPRSSRISPLANARNRFGREGLFEFAKSAAKLAVISIILGVFLSTRMERILSSVYMEVSVATGLLLRLIGEFLFLMLVVSLCIGAIDYLWQRGQFLRRNRMSRQELLDEMKQSEGDPHVKQQRRQRAYDIATNRMLADVPKADVVIVNPTHYAVALKWNRASGRAPVCVAKGVDEIAARIREAAAAAGVPIHSDPPTARALHAALDVGSEIRPEHYRAVAAAIRFAERMRQLARRRHW